MKTKIFILAAMSFSMVGFAQKTEIKAAEKALKGGDAASAKSSLEAAAGSISGADAKLQAQYYYLRGKVYTDLAKKGDDTAFETAISSFQKADEVEKSSGKVKYGKLITQELSALAGEMVNSAVEDNKDKKFKEAGEKLYMSYKLSPRDTIYLYYAASSAVNGGNYEQALTYYNELKEVGYDGGGIEYKATNVATGEQEVMDKVQRDLMVKSGTYKDPVDEKAPSKKAEIVKNMALIYTQLGQDDKALNAYKEARASNPKDVNLILNEANLHYKLGDKEKFKALMAEAATVAPDNPDLHYNIGVINMEQGNLEEAREAYRRALEINPGYTNAQLNLSTTYVNEGNGLIDEMNALGNSRADIARYDELKQQKDDLFQEGANVLEEALKTNPDNQGILTQLKNIYGAMGDNENFMRLKKLLGE
ncbi:tetratricopeptide repeat protein [Maribacter polysiphoniae]|jgi:tetratricopeptide (TPR) repeat protein|uniref:Tetratricopeptide repeat protein n=1 Tax=Maribacter polysiphoniae TaxID=429344 RepID=A0A316E4F2_9FLAO|nr:tetratricopeptide repeat protein [Maribacter polysiphoniae]MBD1260612.1 tetratricopeptide repeat protein [Maribacter polysiphoniae]PWK24259.1 tetratricopeptide repeat protein [Maribacter polysiphoniae]